MPNLFEYTNYRLYLKDAYLARKAERAQFSFRLFSRLAGFSSPNFLKLVMEGERNLSPDSIARISTALKHTKEQARYFHHLVLMNQASSAEERKEHADQILKFRSYRKLHPLTEAQYEYYSRWYVVAVRELVDLKDFREDPAWIARRICPPISSVEAATALELLKKLGLLQYNEEGKLVQSEQIVTAGDEVASAALAGFHHQMIERGSEAIERFPSVERDISSVTLGLSEESAREAKRLIQEFRKKLLALATADSAPARVYEVNFQFFPLSVSSNESGESR